MKRPLLSVLIALVATTAMVLVGLGRVQAQKFETGDTLSVAASQTVNGTYYGAGKNITIAGTVNGDVICGTQSLNISGTIHGDIICGAQTIIITGTVDGNLRLAGQSITIDGKVGRNVSAVGQALTLDGRSTIGGDVSFAGSSLTIDGAIGRDLAAAAQEVTISSRIGRNVEATTSKLVFATGAVVNGTAHYTSNTKAEVAPGAKVPHLQQSTPHQPGRKQTGSWAMNFGFLVAGTLALLFSSLILVLIMPRFFWAVSGETLARPWWVLLTGFVGAIGLPLLVITAFVSIVGIPLAFVLLFVLILLTLLSFPVTAFWLGRLLFGRLFKWTDSAIYLMLLGVAVLVILFAIPYLAVLVWFLMIWFGFGSLLLAFWRQLAHGGYREPQPLKRGTERAPGI